MFLILEWYKNRAAQRSTFVPLSSESLSCQHIDCCRVTSHYQLANYTHRHLPTHTYTHMHRWLLLLHMASLALKACCKLQVIWSSCLKLQCGQNILQCPADQTEILNYHLQPHTNVIVHNALLKKRATRKCHCCICSMTQVVKLILRACLIKISFSLNETA